jgi:hypothetical protein
MNLNDYFSGGYVITKAVDTSSPIPWVKKWFGDQADLLPESILSVGFCGSRFAPFFAWAGASDQDYAAFGIPDDKRDELETWANARFDEEIGFPHIFFNLTTTHEYIARFTRTPNPLQLLGIGVHKDDLWKLAEAEKLNPASREQSGARAAGFSGSGFARAVSFGQPPAQGEIVGFDVIAIRYQIDHSWHCNHLAKDGFEKFHFRPNQFGLINEKANADALATYATEQFIEDSIWLSVLVSRYPIANRAYGTTPS